MIRIGASALGGRLAFLRAPGPWLWAALALGAALRAFLVLATDGTHDVPIWNAHTRYTLEHGLIGYYERQEVFNQPPFAGRAMAALAQLGAALGLPFRVTLRAPFALLDLGNALLLLRLFRGSPARYAVFAGYWLHPLALIFSSYHGNTDAAVGLFALLAVAAAAERRPLAAGAALGLGLWIKLPVALVAPALFFALPGWRDRARFAAMALAVGLSSYLPVLVREPGLLFERVFAYPGMRITTPAGIPIWGFWGLLGWLDAVPARGAMDAHAAWNRPVLALLLLALAFLRRRERSARGLGVTVCASFIAFYALTSSLAFQYLAWCAPFLFFPGAAFCVAATLGIGGYVYAVYAMLTGSLLLLGEWDFRGHPYWPPAVIALRDAAGLFCLVATAAFVAAAARTEWRRARGAP